MRVDARDDALRDDAFDALVAFVDAYVKIVDAGEEPTSELWSPSDETFEDGTGDRATRASLTSAFWCPVDAFDAPRCAVEAAIGALARSGRATASTARIVGAEWWIQDVAHDEPPKVYHTDCDVVMCDDGSSKRSHPTSASVLYVAGDRGGGATCVFDQTTSRANAGELEPTTPSVVCACGVKKNRFFVFDGDRWHGVLHDASEFRGQRVTLLVNWWTSRPAGARSLPKRFVVDGGRCAVAQSGSMTKVERTVVSGRAFADDASSWSAQRLPTDAASGVVEYRYEAP
ncbi:unnamed product [Ostreococcus tauri]|uniref:Unnamed product n=1 Tax=Ostreococcus tauri TaxID=70448 RepID=Q01GM5_OSTTA|nr:unnamed product [Ostreococcus tauri]CAL50119.1 unnamed product [Ostreococcus tauri]|eukprot:XP_003074268.1 unnamed product [Ostreococcus tauri]